MTSTMTARAQVWLLREFLDELCVKTEECRKLFATIKPYVTLGGRNHDSRKVDSESDQLGGDSKHRKTSDRPGKKNDKTKSSDKFQKKDKEAKHSPTKSIRTNDRNTSNPDCDNCGNKHKDAKQDQTRAAVVTKIMRMPIIRDLGNILRLERNTLNCVLTVHH